MTEPASPPPGNEPIIARGGAYYRNTRYILTAVLCLSAFWFAYDGWIGWPKGNHQYDDLTSRIHQVSDQITQARDHGDSAQVDRLERQRVSMTEQLKDIHHHDDLAIMLQKVLAFALPPLGILLSAWAVYNSRGEIRLENRTLSAPGHPPVTFDQIAALDKRLWDRKDIALVEYDTGQAKGRIRLDAFIYQTEPIVKIFDRIEKLMKEEG